MMAQISMTPPRPDRHVPNSPSADSLKLNVALMHLGRFRPGASIILPRHVDRKTDLRAIATAPVAHRSRRPPFVSASIGDNCASLHGQWCQRLGVSVTQIEVG
jgi:hypothetical protein